MEETMGRRRRSSSSSSSAPCLEDIPDLIHKIQLLLSPEEAARTSVLSKSWLNGFSTIPILRFRQTLNSLTKQQKEQHHFEELIDRTLIRYLRDNIPIKMINLKIDEDNKDSAHKWIQHLTTTKTSCLNNLSLLIDISKTSFPDEILSATSLYKLDISGYNSLSMTTTHPPVINCVSLKELHLRDVHIKQEVLDDIMSTCSLLEVLELSWCRGFGNVKVKNLRFIQKISICNYDEPNPKRILEINDQVPNLTHLLSHGTTVSFNRYSFGKVTFLCLGNMIMDDAFLDMIKLQFPLLVTLKLFLSLWKSESFHFKSPSVKDLSLYNGINKVIIVQVNAPKLTSFLFQGSTMPSLVFPAAAANISLLEQIKIHLFLRNPVDASFFLKMSHTLGLSIKCDIQITTFGKTVIQPPFDVDIGNLRKRVPSPAKNVQQLSFQTNGDEGLWEHSPFFSICHPMYVVAKPDMKFQHNNPFCKLMESKVLEEKNSRKAEWYLNWPYYLKSVEIKSEKDESLPDSLRSSLANASAPDTVFKLNWR